MADKVKAFNFQGYTFILLAAFFWGTSGTAQTYAPSAATPLAIGAVRIGLGGLVLFIFALFRGKLPPDKEWPYGKTFLAAVTMAAYQILFFSAVAATGVAVATVVTMGSSPIFAGLLAWLFKRVRPEKSWYAATSAAVIGCALLLLPEAETVVDPFGLLLSAGGGCVYALYALVSKEVLATRSAETLLGLAGLMGGLFLLPLLLISQPTWLLQTEGIQVGLYLGFISMALPYLFFNLGLVMVPIANAMTLTLAEPLTAAFLGIFLVGESLAPLNYLGLILILFGIALLTIKKK